MHQRLGVGPVAVDHGTVREELINGLLSSDPEAPQPSSGRSPASSTPGDIEDMAAQVINPGPTFEDLFPREPDFPFWRSEVGLVSPVRLDCSHTDVFVSKEGDFKAQLPGKRPGSPSQAGPLAVSMVGQSTGDNYGASFSVPPPLDEIPIHSPAMVTMSPTQELAITGPVNAAIQHIVMDSGVATPVKTYFRRRRRLVVSDGMVAAPLPDLLASVEALAGPAGVAVQVGTPHQTPTPGLGCVAVLAETPPMAARLSPVGEDIHLSPAADAFGPGCQVAGDSVAVPTLPGTPNSNQLTSQRRRFLAKMTKKTTKILPTPRANRLRSRACVQRAPPRRSRRIAGMQPDSNGGGAPSRTKKTVMRALGLIGESAGIDQQSLEEYCKLFTGSASLPDIHVQALAALFGWVAPVDEEQDLAAEC